MRTIACDQCLTVLAIEEQNHLGVLVKDFLHEVLPKTDFCSKKCKTEWESYHELSQPNLNLS